MSGPACIGLKALAVGRVHACPFCGTQNQMLSVMPLGSAIGFAVVCECGAVGPHVDGAADNGEDVDTGERLAIEAWDRRLESLS